MNLPASLTAGRTDQARSEALRTASRETGILPAEILIYDEECSRCGKAYRPSPLGDAADGQLLCRRCRLAGGVRS